MIILGDTASSPIAPVLATLDLRVYALEASDTPVRVAILATVLIDA